MTALREFESCAFCPKLCRHVCPVAVGSGREAATPTSMMTTAWSWLSEEADASLALASAQLCVDCGACTRACKLQRPVGELLSELRLELGAHGDPATPEPIASLQGQGDIVAVLTDERDWSEALADSLGRPVATLQTGDQLGAARCELRELPSTHLKRLADLLGRRRAVVADAGSLRVLEAAGVEVAHLAELVDPPPGARVQPTCDGPQLTGLPVPGSLACCGGRAPLSHHHPRVAVEVTEDAARRLGQTRACAADAACARRLSDAGASLSDPIDWLLAAH